MKKQERLSILRSILTERGFVKVPELRKEFSVSDVTIRSDLEMLEKEGLAIRTHGGAALCQPVDKTEPHFNNSILNVAQRASKLILDHSWIFLGSGSTCLAVACRLAENKRNVNILTNSIPIAALATPDSSLNIQLTAGSVHRSKYPFVYGDSMLSSLEGIAVDQAFIGVAGIDLSFGLSVSNAVECSIFSKIHQVAKQTIIVAGIEKFEKRTFRKIGDLSNVDTIITNGEVPSQYILFCKKHNVEILS